MPGGAIGLPNGPTESFWRGASRVDSSATRTVLLFRLPSSLFFNCGFYGNEKRVTVLVAMQRTNSRENFLFLQEKVC